MSSGIIVNFFGGKAGFVRMELGVRILQKSNYPNRNWGKYVLQKFQTRKEVEVNIKTKKNDFGGHFSLVLPIRSLLVDK
jgi:hypothetical protein